MFEITLVPETTPTKKVTLEVMPSNSTTTTLPTIEKTSTISLTPDINFISGNLVCDTFLETTWGNGPTQFGFDHKDRQKSEPLLYHGPYPLQFDEGGKMYVPDHINNRVMIYSNEKSPLKIIHLPNQFIPDDINGDPYRSWWNFSVSDGMIYIPFQDNEDTNWKLGVLTTTGEIKQIYDLSNYILKPPFWLSPVISDRKGGLFIFFTGSDVGYFNSEMDLQYIIKHDLDRWSFDDLIIGFDNQIYSYFHDKLDSYGKTEDVHITKFKKSKNQISGLGETFYVSLGLSEKLYESPLGVDLSGNIYIKLNSGNRNYVARFSVEYNQVIFSKKDISRYDFAGARW